MAIPTGALITTGAAAAAGIYYWYQSTQEQADYDDYEPQEAMVDADDAQPGEDFDYTPDYDYPNEEGIDWDSVKSCVSTILSPVTSIVSSPKRFLFATLVGAGAYLGHSYGLEHGAKLGAAIGASTYFLGKAIVHKIFNRSPLIEANKTQDPVMEDEDMSISAVKDRQIATLQEQLQYTQQQLREKTAELQGCLTALEGGPTASIELLLKTQRMIAEAPAPIRQTTRKEPRRIKAQTPDDIFLKTGPIHQTAIDYIIMYFQYNDPEFFLKRQLLSEFNISKQEIMQLNETGSLDNKIDALKALLASKASKLESGNPLQEKLRYLIQYTELYQS